MEFYLLLFSICLFTVQGFVATEERSPCDVTLDVCIPAVKCPPAVQALRETRHHNFKRCGFIGLKELVCCPLPDNKQGEVTAPSESMSHTTSKAEVRGPIIRKSTQACEDYSNMVGPRVEYQILGGEDAALGEFPHMAALGKEREDSDELDWVCAGSLISNRYVLTAAHCVVNSDGSTPVRIRLGKLDINGNTDNSSPQDIDVANITVHPQYNKRKKTNDICLILLSEPAQFNKYVSPACLYHKADDPKPLLVTGWGTTKFGNLNGSSILQKASLVPVSIPKCIAAHEKADDKANNRITTTNICAISDDGVKDTCQGDSGGPLQVQIKQSSSIYSVVGITSYGRGCGGTYPGVYARVYSYLDWIESIVWPDNY